MTRARAFPAASIAALSIVPLAVACGTPPTGSPMLWALDKAGYVRERDYPLNEHYVTEADVVTITLGTLYLKYIAETEFFNLGEVGGSKQLLVYTEVFDTPESGEPFTSVIFNGDIRGEDFIVSAVDRTIYGPIQFKGHPIRIRLYAIELDKEDNQFGAQILQTLGTVASTAQPEAAPAVGVGVQLGEILLSFNKDDNELTADLTLHPQVLDAEAGTTRPSTASTGVPEDDYRIAKFSMVVNAPATPLRVGNYLLVKAEAKERDAEEDSKDRGYLANDYFTAGDDDQAWIPIYRGGYMWWQEIVPGPDCTPETWDSCDWKAAGTEPYLDKTYAVFGVHTGGRIADENKIREVAREQGAQVQGLLQSGNQEAIIAGMARLGDSAAAAIAATDVLNSVNARAKSDPDFRTDPDFVRSLISELYGADDKTDQISDVFATEYNRKVLRMIRSTVPDFPLWPTSQASDFARIKTIKDRAATDPDAICHARGGLFLWDPKGRGIESRCEATQEGA